MSIEQQILAWCLGYLALVWLCAPEIARLLNKKAGWWVLASPLVALGMILIAVTAWLCDAED